MGDSDESEEDGEEDSCRQTRDIVPEVNPPVSLEGRHGSIHAWRGGSGWEQGAETDAALSCGPGKGSRSL